MTLDKQSTREIWFHGFHALQDKFNEMLPQCATTPSKARALGTAFLQDVMIPFMDAAKDGLLASITKDVQAACDKAARLDKLVNKENV